NPGAETQTVEVTGEAPVLDLEKTSVGLDVTPAMVENMPMNGRDFANLAYLAPGAKMTAPWDPTKVRTSGVGINGSNGRNMNITHTPTCNPTSQFDRWQFGGRFGGPIVKDKDFAFFAWERVIEHTAIPVSPSAFTQLNLVKGLNLGNVTFNPDPAATIPTPYK